MHRLWERQAIKIWLTLLIRAELVFFLWHKTMLLDASVQGDCGPVKDKFRRITLSAGMMVKLQRTKVKRRVQTSPPPLQNVEFHQHFNYTAVFRVFFKCKWCFFKCKWLEIITISSARVGSKDHLRRKLSLSGSALRCNLTEFCVISLLAFRYRVYLHYRSCWRRKRRDPNPNLISSSTNVTSQIRFWERKEKINTKVFLGATKRVLHTSVIIDFLRTSVRALFTTVKFVKRRKRESIKNWVVGTL